MNVDKFFELLTPEPLVEDQQTVLSQPQDPDLLILYSFFFSINQFPLLLTLWENKNGKLNFPLLKKVKLSYYIILVRELGKLKGFKGENIVSIQSDFTKPVILQNIDEMIKIFEEFELYENCSLLMKLRNSFTGILS